MFHMGIDLGVRKISFAVFDDDELIHLEHFEIKPGKDRAEELATLIELMRYYPLKGIGSFFVEEPLVGRSTRVSLRIAQTAGAVLAYLGQNSTAPVQLVSTTAWKKAVVGRGNAKKEEISAWLEREHGDWYERCAATGKLNQDLVDATCIGLYSIEVGTRSGEFAPIRLV